MKMRSARLCTSVILMALLVLAAAASAATTTITFQYRTGPAREATVAKWIEEFEKLYPHIHVEFMPVVDKLGERTATAWAAGTGPDVTEMWGDDAQSMARAGALLDLRPYVKRDFTAQDIQDFFPSAWEASFLTYGRNAGIQFRIPRYMITTVMYYNADLFAQAGIPNPTELEAQKNWTWATLREAARKLTLRDADKTQRYGFTTDTGAYRRLVVWARAGGGDFFDAKDPTRFVGAEPASVQGLAMLQDMIWQDFSTATTYEKRQFASAGVAIMEEGNHAVIATYDPAVGDAFRWNIAPSPVGPAGRKSYSGDDGFVIWSGCKNPDAAWTFVKFLTSKRGQEIAAEIEGLAPVRRSAMPRYIELNTKYDLGVHFTNMADASLPISSYLVGDAKSIDAKFKEILTATLTTNQKPWAVAMREAAPVFESLSRK